MIALAATLVCFVLVFTIAVFTARGPDGPMPDRGTRTGGLDASLIEVEAATLLKTQALPDPELLEVARHQAFVLAGLTGAPTIAADAEDHRARRERLYPRFVGWSEERSVSLTAAPGLRERELARLLVEALGSEWTSQDLVLGAGAQGRRVTLVVVRGERIATLNSDPMRGVAEGDYALEGVMAPGRQPGAVAASLVVGGRPPVVFGVGSAHGSPPDDPETPQRFVLRGEIPPGTESALLHAHCGGRLVLTVAVREGAT